MTAQLQSRPTMAYYSMRVGGIRELTPHMLRVTFIGDELRDLRGAGPDAYIKLFFPLVGQQRPVLPPQPSERGTSWYRTYLDMPDEVRPSMRTYTIRAQRPELGEIDVDFVLHDELGPATRWLQTAKQGDEVAFLGPNGLYSVPIGAQWQLIIGDEAALPAIGSIIEGLGEHTHARVFVEIEDATEELHFDTEANVVIDWIHRNNAPHGERLLDAVRNAQFPEGAPYAWIAGESGLVKFARRHLVRERGVDKTSITFTGYWRIGATEEDTSRENARKIDAGEPIVAED